MSLSLAGCFYKPTLRKTQAQPINPRQPLDIQLTAVQIQIQKTTKQRKHDADAVTLWVPWRAASGDVFTRMRKTQIQCRITGCLCYIFIITPYLYVPWLSGVNRLCMCFFQSWFVKTTNQQQSCCSQFLAVAPPSTRQTPVWQTHKQSGSSKKEISPISLTPSDFNLQYQVWTTQFFQQLQYFSYGPLTEHRSGDRARALLTGHTAGWIWALPQWYGTLPSSFHFSLFL